MNVLHECKFIRFLIFYYIFLYVNISICLVISTCVLGTSLGFFFALLILIKVVFTPHVPGYFLPSRHNFGDIELKFCILL